MRYTIEIEDRQQARKALAYIGVKTTGSGVSFHYSGKIIITNRMVVTSIWDIIYFLNTSPARGLYTIKQKDVLCFKAHTTSGGGGANQGSSFQRVTEGVPTNIPNVRGVFRSWEVTQDTSSQGWWVFAHSLEEAEKLLAQPIRLL